jgi:hypothetical protein
MPRSRHRTGRPWRRAKAQMQATYGDICHLCGHPGAGEADHLDALAIDPTQPIDWRRLRPAHGSNYPCPTCPGNDRRGRACNQERGIRPADQVFRPKGAW